MPDGFRITTTAGVTEIVGTEIALRTIVHAINKALRDGKSVMTGDHTGDATLVIRRTENWPLP